jgi:hypothetical protein
MKTFLLLSAATGMMLAAVNAQTNKLLVKNDLSNLHRHEKVIKKEIKEDKKELRNLEGKEVSYLARQAFYRDFGRLPDISWKRGTYFDEATFNKKARKITAYYDYDAELVGTTMHKRFEDLPAMAKNYINKDYKDFDPEEVIFFHDNNSNEMHMILYGNRLEDADSYFVVLDKANKKVILRVNMLGQVSFFKKI